MQSIRRKPILMLRTEKNDILLGCHPITNYIFVKK